MGVMVNRRFALAAKLIAISHGMKSVVRIINLDGADYLYKSDYVSEVR